MFNNLQQQQWSEIMMFHPWRYYDQSFYYSRPANDLAANGFHSNSSFPTNNRRPVNQVRLILADSGTNDDSRESNQRGRHSVALARVSIEDGIAIIDDVRREFINIDVGLSFEEGTVVLNESGLGITGRDNNGNGNEEKVLLAEKIWHHLSTRFHQIPSSSSDQDSGFCAVCQSEYENGETLGLLDCGHEYHSDCIHKWLLEKNVCPICKCKAISQLEKL